MSFKTKFISSITVSLIIVGEARATDAEPTPMTTIEVDGYIQDTIATSLPEKQQVGAEFLDPVYDPTLVFTDDAQVSVTFLSEGAGYRNSLGYFAYDANAFDGVSFSDIDSDNSGFIDARELEVMDGVTDVGIIFGNASGSGGFAGTGGTLETGDTYVLGGGTYTDLEDGSWTMTGGTEFAADTQLGFFVSANTWNGTSVDGWDNDDANPTYYTEDFLNPENPDTATVDDADSLSRHVAMLNIVGENELLLGFEDLNRNSGDNDFNDAVFLIRTTPSDAYETTNLPTVSPAPSSGVGILAWCLMAFGFYRVRKKRNQ